MATKQGTVNSVRELLQAVTLFLIDASNFSGQSWKLMSPAAVDANTREVILKGVGDGADEIYIGMQIVDQGDAQQNLRLNGFAGYDPHLEWYEQPGSIYTDKLPVIPLARDVNMDYWLTANTSRITLTVQMSNQYETAYLGFIKPFAIERQYPYPLLIGGSAYEGEVWSNHGNSHSSHIAPVLSNGGSALCLRRPDGVWAYGANDGNLAVWPTDVKPVDTFTIYNKGETQPDPEDHMLYPMMIYEKKPTDMFGQLDGVYWVGNRADLAAKDIVIYRGVTYIVFNNIYGRGDDSYFVIEWR